MKKFLAFALLFSVQVRADLLKDFDSLGGNDVLLERAKELNPEQKIYVVQDRIVDRFRRFEFAPEYASVLGGDSFMESRQYGVNIHFHFNPRWSLGAKYSYMNNSLSRDGENLIQDTSIIGKYKIPDIDFPKNQKLAFVNYYPIYGKMNLFNAGVSHFDVYGQLGYGQIELKSGTTPTWTAGAGVGFWISQHVTTRLEFRYQNYKAQRYDGPTSMDLTLIGIQVGYLL